MKDSSVLAYKFSDKKFLKQNEFAEAMGRVWSFIKKNRNLVISFLSVITLLGLGIFGLKLYHGHRIQLLSEASFAAKTSLKKEALYRAILARYSDIPASQMARLNLAEYLVENQKNAEAQKVLSEGLKGADKTIFSTLVVLKAVDLLKTEKKYGEAAALASENEKHVMDYFLPRLKLLRANLLLLAGKKEDAKSAYQNLSQVADIDVGDKKSKEFDPTVVDEAKDQLLLMELGVL